mmetsp:Transcript_95752/g.189811  ORF Transcript_95752/g.189811 Transcript_95752/m.189811 type:complete len:214 (-) Transcript_95752:26-667(-)
MRKFFRDMLLLTQQHKKLYDKVSSCVVSSSYVCSLIRVKQRIELLQRKQQDTRFTVSGSVGHGHDAIPHCKAAGKGKGYSPTLIIGTKRPQRQLRRNLQHLEGWMVREAVRKVAIFFCAWALDMKQREKVGPWQMWCGVWLIDQKSLPRATNGIVWMLILQPHKGQMSGSYLVATTDWSSRLLIVIHFHDRVRRDAIHKVQLPAPLERNPIFL